LTRTNHVGNGVKRIKIEGSPSRAAIGTADLPDQATTSKSAMKARREEDDDEELVEHKPIIRENTEDLYDVTPAYRRSVAPPSRETRPLASGSGSSQVGNLLLSIAEIRRRGGGDQGTDEGDPVAAASQEVEQVEETAAVFWEDGTWDWLGLIGRRLRD
jgi:hypothetical protein